MKAKVINIFVDKHTKKLQNVGSTVDLSDERFRDLSGKGFVAPLQAPPEKPETPKPKGAQ